MLSQEQQTVWIILQPCRISSKHLVSKITHTKFLTLSTFVKQTTLLPEKFMPSAPSGVEKETCDN